MYKAEQLRKWRGAELWHSRGYLPHFELPQGIQFITYRLADSLPLAHLRRLQARYLGKAPAELSGAIEAQLDRGLGSCVLKRPDLADIVEENLLNFDGQRYSLISWCIMPNHVHVLLQLHDGVTLSKVLHSWKSYTSKQINAVLGRNGRLWQPEYFDRVMRDEEHLGRTIEYIERNPVMARLCQRSEEFQFSSARLRAL